MRALLDEGIPRRLAGLLADRGIDADAFPNDWKSLGDRELIEQTVAAGYSVLVTMDRNMPYQRPLSRLRLAVLIVPRLDRGDVLRRAPEIADRLRSLEPGRYALLGREGSLPDPPPRKPL